ncbi:response regulator [Clostridium sp. KNHs205]|jgi:two-component system, response regulator YesN|uniref:response regulator transcription factor n=1 Tax=Clostridium sp. KNHs205 TaxID=1449050 RepID=UPI00051C687D|nr:response regulator [Clostridium sp. KNHs205]
MRILIVEDEPKTREGLVSIISKFTEYEICGIASDGTEGIGKIKELKPDLIITDIQMPEMDGLTMLRQVEQDNLSYYALILTGYSSFEYARTALQLGVIDYILKPVDTVSFLSLLRETETKIRKEEQQKIDTAHLIWGLMTCKPQVKEQLLHQLALQLHVNDRMEITLFLVKPDSIDQETADEMLHCIKEKMDELCIMNIQVVHLPSSYGILVLIMDTENNKHISRRFSTCILPCLHRIGGCHCSYTAITGLILIKEAITELNNLLSYGFVCGSEVILDKAMVEKLTFTAISYPMDLDNRIRKEIMNGDYEKALRTSNRFKEVIIESKGRPELIREYTARYSSSIYNAAREYNTKTEPLLIFHYFINNIIDSKTKADLTANYEKIVNTVLAIEHEEADIDNLTVLKVINYIRDNYRKDITLSEAANLVGVTPEYLSKLFSQQIKVNFVVFLRNFRISIAKRMLLSGKYRIQEVADQVGFKDPKYFNKVFKSVCGISPTEYKKVI